MLSPPCILNISDTSIFIHSIDDTGNTSYRTDKSEYMLKSNIICFKSNFAIISIIFTRINVSNSFGRNDNAILSIFLSCISSIYEYILLENSSKSINA